MKKLSILVAVVAMIALMTTSAFAAPADYFAFDATEVAYTGENVTVTFKYTGSNFLFNRGGTFQLNYDSANWDLVSLESGCADATLTDMGTIAKWTLPSSGGPFTVTEDLLTLTFALKDGGVAEGSKIVSYKQANVRLSDGTQLARANDTSDMAVTVVAGGSTENVATYVTNELALEVDGKAHNFTDVPVYTATTNATSFKLKAVYGENENYLKFNGAEEINVSNIKVEGDGDVSFQVAIIGVPAGVTIDKLVVE
jgi:hypothetical protein